MTYPSKAERLITLNEVFKEAKVREDELTGIITFDRTVEGEPDEELFTLYLPAGFHRRQQACISFFKGQLVLIGLNASPYVDDLLRDEDGQYDVDFFTLKAVLEKFITTPIVATAMCSELHFVHIPANKEHAVMFGGKTIMLITTDRIGPLAKLYSMISVEARINGNLSRLWVYSTTSDMSLPGCLTSSIIQMYLERYS